MKRVGVIGGGQLAWMMADAAQKLGVELIVQTPSVHDPPCQSLRKLFSRQLMMQVLQKY